MKKSLTFAVALFAAASLAAPASAHTETDVVAVPAGSEATVSLKPTHGCGESPTVAVAVQAPVEGATAEPVDGWTATATADGQGNTVLEWTGGVLPVDQTGAFPVNFTAPNEPGRLLLFPSVQTCEDGSELSWISGDPADEFPAPRVLILPADQPPAGSVDEVDPGAPGRDQLTEIIIIDGATETTVDAAPETTVAPTTTLPADEDVVTVDEATDDDEDSNTGRNIAIAVALVVVLGGGAAFVIRRQRNEDEVDT